MNFEKYVDMAINMPLLFILKNSNYLKAEGKTFKDFMDTLRPKSKFSNYEKQLDNTVTQYTFSR